MKTRSRPRLLGSPLIALGAFLATCTLFIPAAHADRKSALKHYNAGTKAYNLGRFEEAIAAFEKAYDEDPAPILLFNIAQSHRQLGRHERALFFYRRYLEADPDSKNRADVETRMAEAQRALNREKTLAPPPPAVAATSPASPSRDSTAPSTSPAPPATRLPAAPSPSATEAAPAVEASAENASAPRASRNLRTAAFVVGGVGVAGLVTGAIFGSLAASAGDTQSKAERFDRDADEAGKSKETLQYVFYGIGGAAVATAAVLFALDLRQQNEHVAVIPVVTAHSTGFAARMSF